MDGVGVGGPKRAREGQAGPCAWLSARGRGHAARAKEAGATAMAFTVVGKGVREGGAPPFPQRQAQEEARPHLGDPEGKMWPLLWEPLFRGGIPVCVAPMGQHTPCSLWEASEWESGLGVWSGRELLTCLGVGPHTEKETQPCLGGT